MTIGEILLLTIGVVFGLPILAYLVMKFGTAGLLRAKQRQQEKEQAKEKEQI